MSATQRVDILPGGETDMKDVVHASRDTAREARTPLADKVQRFIEANYGKGITTSSIARDLGYNADYIERVFRAHRSMSVTEALHQKRIGVARALLNGAPEKNVNEIAYTCGYVDPGYFRRMFKRVTGLTPRAFRSLSSLACELHKPYVV